MQNQTTTTTALISSDIDRLAIGRDYPAAASLIEANLRDLTAEQLIAASAGLLTAADAGYLVALRDAVRAGHQTRLPIHDDVDLSMVGNIAEAPAAALRQLLQLRAEQQVDSDVDPEMDADDIANVRRVLRAAYGTRQYRITRAGEIHVYGQMPNSNTAGRWLFGYLGDSDTRARLDQLAD